MNIYVARQPILDEENIVVAYELLFRENDINSFSNDIEGDVATSILLINSYISYGINRLSEGKKVFINFDKKLMIADIPRLLNTDDVIIDALIPLPKESEYKRSLEGLKKEGYTIAMEVDLANVDNEYIYEFCDIIEVDILKTKKDQVIQIAKRWLNTDKTLIAKKVETHEVYEWAKSIGFKLFQGYYFCKPEMISTKNLLPAKNKYIRILDELSKEEPEYVAISEIIESDPLLTYRLLKLVNANFVSYNKVSTVKQAIVTVGLGDLAKWVNLTMIADLAANKPPELLKLALLRGKFLELVFKFTLGESKSSEGMLIGLLSVIDGLTDQLMEDAIKDLPLELQIKDTLLKKETPYQVFYEVILNIERGNYGVAYTALDKASIYVKDLMEYYYESITWSSSMFTLIKDGV